MVLYGHDSTRTVAKAYIILYREVHQWMRTAAHRESRDDEAQTVTRAARHKNGAGKVPSGHHNAADPPRRHKTPPLLAREGVVPKDSRQAADTKGHSSALAKVQTLTRGRIMVAKPHGHRDTVPRTPVKLVRQIVVHLERMVVHRVASPSHPSR
jgi:hypothetical protein